MVSYDSLIKKVNVVIVFVISCCSVVFGIFFAGIILPRIIKFAMKTQLRVTPGTMSRDMFEKVPFAIDFRVYFWNVTNKDEVMSGGKPILKEVGPYYLEEWKDKIDIIDDKEEDTMEYDYRNTYIYDPTMNGPGLTGEEIITVAHPILLALALAVNTDKQDLLPMINVAINGLFNNPKDIFYTGRVLDLLIDGIVLDCSSDAFEVTAVCSEFDSDEYRELKRINATAFSFSMFGNSNGSSIGRFKVMRGKKNIKELGRVITYNGESELDAWYDDECNQIYGTDGTIFPPFQKKKNGFTVFVPQMCRTMTARYKGKSAYVGIKTRRYTMSYDVTNPKKPNCFCRDNEDCPPKGMLDLFPCSGTPITVSLPHFLDVDPDVLKKVEGPSPDKEKHQFFMDFYQYAGAPVSAYGRGQLNFQVVPIPEIPLFENLQEMYLPFIWFENGVSLSKKYTNMLKYQLILVKKIRVFLIWTCILGGLAGIAFTGVATFEQVFGDGSNVRQMSESETKIS